MRGFVPATGGEETLFQRRVADLVKAASHSGQPRFTGFLSDRERELAQAQLHRSAWPGYRYEGGYEGAERVMLCVFEDKEALADFPIAAAFIETGAAALTHRDYLGAILATGIKRECVGDILPGETGAVVYLQRALYPHLEEQLTSVGRHAARVSPASPMGEVPPKGEPPEQSASVASLRLDGVLAAMLHQSRSAAAALVQSGRVQVNHRLVESVHYSVQPDDVFSIRGIGKFRFCRTGGTSRKNRVTIHYQKY